jgi:non-specific serine/threonine protein kinase
MSERTADTEDGQSAAPDTGAWAGPLSARDAAALLGISERTVRRAIARGELTATKHAGVYRIAPPDLAGFGRRHLGSATAARDRRTAPRLIRLSPPHTDRPPPLPIPLTPLFGRERQVAEALALVNRADVRLATMTGPGGIGKTRLALAVAQDAADAFPDGVWFVDLATTADPSLVLPALARVLGVREGTDRPLADRLASRLAGRRLLLLLDNVEQVLGAAPEIAALLKSSPGVRVLATSREPLRVHGEHRYPVPPLDLPELDRLPPPGALTRFGAIALFLHQARAQLPAFALDAGTAPAIAELCVRLDGLPLAIELAAAWTGTLLPGEMVARLADRPALLTGGPRDHPARLQTMRGAIAWSLDLLDAREQALFRRLAVFRGGFSVQAAEQVGGDPDISAAPVLSGVRSLTEKSLLVRATGLDGGSRFGMLETVRDYGLERLAASGEEAAVRDAHAAWCLAFAEETEPQLAGPEQHRWLARLDEEHANLRAALVWLLDAGTGEAALRLASALGQFWVRRGLFAEGRDWIERALDRAAGEAVADPVRSKALLAGALVAGNQGDADRAIALDEEALKRCRASGDRGGAAQALLGLARVAQDRADHERAVVLLDEALATFRELGERSLTAVCLHDLGLIAHERGAHDRAESLFADALRELEPFGPASGLTNCIPGHLGDVARARGDLPRAAALHRESLARNRARGDLVKAFENLCGLAAVAGDRGDFGRAARLLGTAEAYREPAGPPTRHSLRAAFAEVASSAQRALGAPAFAAERAVGHRLAPTEVDAEADAVVAGAAEGRGAKASDRASGYGLTPREREVLRLLADGLSDRQIAAALFVSYRTVTNHVAGILGKLRVESRTAAVAFAVRNGLDRRA